jgi:hypothetical protein
MSPANHILTEDYIFEIPGQPRTGEYQNQLAF